MNLRDMAMIASLTVTSAAAVAAMDDTSRAVSNAPSHQKLTVDEPVWPNNGIAQRVLGDGTDAPDDLFVEHVGGEWIAWVVMRPASGGPKAKALNFFSGEIIDVTGDFDRQYIDSFTDMHGVEHKETLDQIFDFYDGRSGNSIGNIKFDGPYVEIPRAGMASVSLKSYQAFNHDRSAIRWSKVAMFRCTSCQDRDWDSLFSTALDLRDGTMLVSTGNRYVFRIRMHDLSAVGDAPALHIFDEDTIQREVAKGAKEGASDVFSYVLKALRLADAD